MNAISRMNETIVRNGVQIMNSVRCVCVKNVLMQTPQRYDAPERLLAWVAIGIQSGLRARTSRRRERESLTAIKLCVSAEQTLSRK